MKNILLAMAMLALSFSVCAAPNNSTTSAVAASSGTAEALPLGIDEHLGNVIPLDLPFRDEAGNLTTLRALVKRPTILSLVYFECPGVCTPLLSALAKVAGELKMRPGVDYDIITVSFDETETPEIAAQKKFNYLQTIGKPFPAEAWHFLTGDLQSIKQLTDAVGFAFKRDGEDFIHPTTLIVLSPQGKIARYLYGANYLPLDVQLALVEASEGRVGPTINKVLKFCFSYDPAGRRYMLNVNRVAGVTVSLFGLGFFLYLTRRKKPTASSNLPQA